MWATRQEAGHAQFGLFNYQKRNGVMIVPGKWSTRRAMSRYNSGVLFLLAHYDTLRVHGDGLGRLLVCI
jgi:hypothetical protein